MDFEKPNEENNNGEENGEDNEAEPEKFIYYKGILFFYTVVESILIWLDAFLFQNSSKCWIFEKRDEKEVLSAIVWSYL